MRRRTLIRAAGGVVGAGLLVTAVATAVRQPDTWDSALRALSREHAAATAILVAATFANLMLTAALFHQLMRRFGSIGRGEMLALIAAATLLNYLPLVRPGLIGRVAWHQRVNGIPVRSSVRVVVESVVLSGIVFGLVLLAIVAPQPLSGALIVIGAIAIVVAIIMIIATAAPISSRIQWREGGAAPATRVASAMYWTGAVGIRLLDASCWAVRYWAALSMLGIDARPSTCFALACAGMAATLVPLAGNGLGLREWATGLLAPVLAGAPLASGITAELLNRAAELVIVVPAGLIAIGWLWRRRQARPRPSG